MSLILISDDPPTECSVDQDRDCADGICILTAIANYTMRIVDEDLSADQVQEALKFLDHVSTCKP